LTSNQIKISIRKFIFKTLESLPSAVCFASDATSLAVAFTSSTFSDAAACTSPAKIMKFQKNFKKNNKNLYLFLVHFL